MSLYDSIDTGDEESFDYRYVSVDVDDSIYPDTERYYNKPRQNFYDESIVADSLDVNNHKYHGIVADSLDVNDANVEDSRFEDANDTPFPEYGQRVSLSTLQFSGPAQSDILRGDPDVDEYEQHKHAMTIQSHFRGYQTRKEWAEQHEEKIEQPIRKESFKENTRGQFRKTSGEDLKQRSLNGDSNDNLKSESINQHVFEEQLPRQTTHDDSVLSNDQPQHDLTLLNEKATVIQSNYRGYKARKNMNVPRENNKVNAEKSFSKEYDENAVITIQSHYRGHVARREFKEWQDSQAKENTPENVGADAEKEEAAALIHAHIRGAQVRKDFERFQDRFSYHYESENSRFSEATDHHSLENDSDHQNVPLSINDDSSDNQQHHCAVVIQSNYRGYKARKDLRNKQTEKESRVMIQGAAKGYIERKGIVNKATTEKSFERDSKAEDSLEKVWERRSSQQRSAETKRLLKSEKSSEGKPMRRKYTEYLEHSNWEARQNLKKTLREKIESKQVSDIKTPPGPSKRYHAKPIVKNYVRSITVPNTNLVSKSTKNIQTELTKDLADLKREDAYQQSILTSTSQSKSQVAFDEPFEERETKLYPKSPLPPLSPDYYENSSSSFSRGDHGKENHRRGYETTSSEEDSYSEQSIENVPYRSPVYYQNQPMPVHPQKIAFVPVPFNQMHPLEQVLYAAQNFGGYHQNTGQYYPMPPPNPQQMQPSEKENIKKQNETKMNNEVKKTSSKSTPSKDFLALNKNLSRDKSKKYSELLDKKYSPQKGTPATEEHSEEKEAKPKQTKKVENNKLIETKTTTTGDHQVKVDINLNFNPENLASLLGLSNESPRMPQSFRQSFENYQGMPYYPYQPSPPFPNNQGDTWASSRTLPDHKDPRYFQDVNNNTYRQSQNQNADKDQRRSKEFEVIQKQPNPYKKVPPIKGTNDKSRNPHETSPVKHKMEKNKPRVDYKPYTMEDYKNLNLDVNLPASLGPDWDKIEEKRLKRLRQREYAEQIKEQNASLPRKNVLPQTTESEEKLSRRKVGVEYSKSVPRPQVRQRPPKDPPVSSHIQTEDSQLLEKLKLRHEQEKRALQAT